MNFLSILSPSFITLSIFCFISPLFRKALLYNLKRITFYFMILSKNDYNMSDGLIQHDLISSRSRRIQRVLGRSLVSERRYGLE